MFPFDKRMAPDLPDQGDSFLVTAPNAYAGVLGYEMSQLVKSVRPFLATPARQSGSGLRTGQVT